MPISKILSGSFASGVGGKVLQVKQTVITTGASINSTTHVDSVLTVNITPSSTTSKIMVNVNGYFGIHFWHGGPYWRLRRDTTVISGNATAVFPRVQYDSTRDGNTTYPLVMNILDSPSSTSQLTYTVQGATSNASYPIYLNRPHNDSTTNTQTSITVMEIAG
jgi:hypothetical protein